MNNQMNLNMEKTITISIVHCMRCKNVGDATLYCGRMGSWHKVPNWQTNMRLGNPFTVKEFGLGGCIARFERYLDENPDGGAMTRIKFMALRIVKQNYTNIQLSCWCSPKACHCNVIRRKLINEIRDITK